MDATQLIQQIGQSLGANATVKAVYGEPISVGNKTVVPVARIAYGFGGGGGSDRARHTTSEGAAREGGGGGGGLNATPAGALEITPEGTRFVPFTDLRWLAAAFGAGAICGGFLLRRR